MAKGGARPGAGNPGYGKMKQLEANMNKFSPRFWKLMDEHSKSNDKNDQRFFMTEYNKLQTKMIPQVVGGDPDNRTPIPIYGKFSLQGHDSDSKDIRVNA